MPSVVCHLRCGLLFSCLLSEKLILTSGVICADEEKLRAGGGRLEGVEMQAIDHEESESGSIDDELEMQELLAALGEQERDPEGEEEGTHTLDDLQLMKGGALSFFFLCFWFVLGESTKKRGAVSFRFYGGGRTIIAASCWD